MPIKLKDIETTKNKWQKKVNDIINTLKDGEGMTLEELLEKLSCSEWVLRKVTIPKIKIGNRLYYCNSKTANKYDL